MRLAPPTVRLPFALEGVGANSSRTAASITAAVLMLAAGCRSHPTPASTPSASPSAAVSRSADAAPVSSSSRAAPTTVHAPPATRDEVVKTAVSVFGDSAVVTVADSVNPEEPAWDLDVRSYETHDRVEYYVDLFTNKARERFVQRLSRGTRYEPMIRAKLRASGMPEDLTYLALIESGYDPHAYSRAAAVGMWQFMSSTARDVGLRVDWWMDERRDPARATDGAIKFLGYLQKQFGSFYLAAAAYNGGPGRVSKGLTRFADELEGHSGEDRFFALAEQDYLRAETKNYVPQLIAAALVGKMPNKYGITLDSMPLYAYDSVEVAAGTSLQALASVGRLSPNEMRDLNPAILRGVTPPDARVWIRVPSGQGEATRAAIDGAEAGVLRGFESVEVKGSTTTAAGLADKHGITVKQLRWYNPTLKTTKKGKLVAGQTVRIPAHEAVALARELPDPSIERYGPGGVSALSARGVHVVKRGETIGTIARRYGLSEARLRSLNGLRGSRLLAGQTLVVRGTTRTRKAAATLTDNTKSTVVNISGKKTSASKTKQTAKAKVTKKPTSKSKAKSSKKPAKSSAKKKR